MGLQRKRGFYEKYIKRLLDIVCSGLAMVFFFWLYILIAILVRLKLGSPVLFTQPRPGIIKDGKETIFYMYKFRTMTNAKDGMGNLLPDEARLTKFGRTLRATSLDELPEAFNIFKGDMSIVGPRPQLVKDMVFMSERQRMRHTAKPGLSGLAQVKGRNAISWEEKLNWDLRYIEHVNFFNDCRIVLETVKRVFGRNESTAELDITLDYGDELLKEQKVTIERYNSLQAYAKELIGGVAK